MITDLAARITVLREKKRLSDASMHCSWVTAEWDAWLIAAAELAIPLADEIERLWRIIDNAPHEEDCEYITSLLDSLTDRPRRPVAKCVCWKSVVRR